MLQFSRSLYLCNHLLGSIHSWTKGTCNPTPPLPYPTLTLAYPFYPTLPTPTSPTLPSPSLPYLTLLYPTQPIPLLPYPALPYPTQPYPTSTPTLPSKNSNTCTFKHMRITKPVAVELRCHTIALIQKY